MPSVWIPSAPDRTWGLCGSSPVSSCARRWVACLGTVWNKVWHAAHSSGSSSFSSALHWCGEERTPSRMCWLELPAGWAASSIWWISLWGDSGTSWVCRSLVFSFEVFKRQQHPAFWWTARVRKVRWETRSSTQRWQWVPSKLVTPRLHLRISSGRRRSA